ncbi:MAG: hypothetical protein IJ083_08780 [Clostridia bacterium]|nr:hypothetical protein [Clostridia bacterium]
MKGNSMTDAPEHKTASEDAAQSQVRGGSSDWKMLIWISQLGLSTCLPLAGFTLLGIYLCDRFSWPRGVIIIFLLLGLISGFSGLREAWQAMNHMERMQKKYDAAHPQKKGGKFRAGSFDLSDPQEPPPPAVSFQEHE